MLGRIIGADFVYDLAFRLDLEDLERDVGIGRIRGGLRGVRRRGNGALVRFLRDRRIGARPWGRMGAVGDREVSGVRAMLNGSGENLTAESVHILNLGGFTGTYAKDDGGEASASFGSETFTITGTANGFNTYKPDQPATATFKIVATC